MPKEDKKEFYEDCEKIIKHFESLNKELNESKEETKKLLESREEAQKQATFSYGIASSLDVELRRYSRAIEKVLFSLKNIYQNSNFEGKSAIKALQTYLTPFLRDKESKNNSDNTNVNTESEPKKKLTKKITKSSCVIEDEVQPKEFTSVSRSTGNSLDNVEAFSESHSINEPTKKIKIEQIEQIEEKKSKDTSKLVRNRKRDNSLNEISDNGEEFKRNSASGNSGTDGNSDDRLEKRRARRAERRQNLHQQRPRVSEQPLIAAHLQGNRAFVYDIPRVGNIYMNFPEYGTPVYNHQNNPYFEMYNSGLQPFHPMQFYPPNRQVYNTNGSLYNGNGTTNGISYSGLDTYLEFNNGGTDTLGSQALVEAPEDARRGSIGLNALTVKATYLHDDVVCSVALGGEFLAATAGKGIIKLWDTRRSSVDTPILSIDNQASKYIRSCKISENGKSLVVAGECDYLGLWDLESYTAGTVIQAPTKRMELGESAGACYSLVLSNDSRTCYAGCSNGNILLWDLVSNKIVKTIQGHTDIVTCMDMPLDSNKLFSGSFDCTAVKWDMREYKMECQYKNSSQVYSIAASTSCGLVTMGLEDSIVSVFTSDEAKVELKVHTSSVLAMKMSRNGDWLLSVGKDGIVNAIRMPHGPPVHRTSEEGPILSCDMSPNAKYVLTGSSGRKCTLYDVSL